MIISNENKISKKETKIKKSVYYKRLFNQSAKKVKSQSKR